MPRILILSTFFPFPLNNGGNVRLYNILLSASRMFSVTLVCPAPENPDDAEPIAKICERVVNFSTQFAETGDQPGFRRRLRYGLVSRNLTRLLEDAHVAAAGEDLLSFDLIWVERLILAPSVAGHEHRTIVDFDDIIHRKFFREARTESGFGKRGRALERSARWFYKEVWGARRYLANVVCSEDDKQYLDRLGLKNVAVMPNGTSVGPPGLTAVGSWDGPPRMVFVGNMVYAPNRDALAFYVADIAPHLRQVFGNIFLDVVGPGSDTDLAEQYGDTVRFIGFVDDLGQTLSKYDLLLAPLRLGGGTKLKVLDAMANHLPVVTTPVGAEGLSLEHGVSALIGKSGPDLARHVADVHRDRALGRRLAEAAYDVAVSRFQWEGIRDRLSDWLEQMAHAGR